MGRRKHLHVGTFAVMVDDTGTKVATERAEILPPSYKVETSPGNFQNWLFLDQPIMDADLAAALIKSMIRDGLACGDDPGMAGVTRVGRPPFGHNDKKKHGPEPFRVRCVEWAPERRYTVEEIIRAYGLKLEAPRKRNAGSPPAPEVLSANEGLFHAVLNEFDRHGYYLRPGSNGWHHVRCPWHHRHSTRPDEGAALAEPSEANGWLGGFSCHHKCSEGYRDVLDWLAEGGPR
jgi:hypothetical protein